MKKIIIINDKSIEYELTYKKVKNINLRINRGGKISVSAPKRIPVSYIETFMSERSDFITNALTKLADMSVTEDRVKYDDGEDLLVLGRHYTIKKQLSKRSKAVINDDGTATIFVTDTSCDSASKSVMKLYSSICEREVYDMCENIFKEFSGVSDTMPKIQFRKARGRWGTCYSNRKTVILNKYLAALPPDLINYVIYHEFTHLIHANHSKSFYEELKKRCPEHEIFKKQLNGFSYLLK
jgi:predicted metal-dependent hydrolase